jgi:hypothetical protein
MLCPLAVIFSGDGILDGRMNKRGNDEAVFANRAQPFSL